jgi:hypothetical protein
MIALHFYKIPVRNLFSLNESLSCVKQMQFSVRNTKLLHRGASDHGAVHIAELEVVLMGTVEIPCPHLAVQLSQRKRVLLLLFLTTQFHVSLSILFAALLL